MPDSAPVSAPDSAPDSGHLRLPPAEALDEGLAALFRTMAAQPAPAGLIALADRLDAVSRASARSEDRAFA